MGMLCIFLLLLSCKAKETSTAGTTEETIEMNETIAETKTTTAAIVNTLREFTIQAFRFGYMPDTITVNKGDRVKITIENLDMMHGMKIPELGVGNNERLEFTANEAGEFQWYCNNFCGSGHGSMSGTLVVKG